MTAFDNMVPCTSCAHGAGHHDGAGCSIHGCACAATKETVMLRSIEVMWQEDRARFAADPDAAGRR